jgi:hypothetical protein
MLGGEVMAKWRVSYLGRRIGTIEAPDEKSAVAEAMKTFHITPTRRFLIRVTEVKEQKAPTTSAAGEGLIGQVKELLVGS